jgi:2-C-methyl-D-erythritol 4-phosphate cytidylyltransferase
MLLRVKRLGIILAGGSGQRFGDQIPKQFIRLAGESVLRRSVVALASGGALDHIVVAANPDWLNETNEALKGLLGPALSVVPGGSSRNESTRAGLDALKAADDDIVLIHDAVRPLLSRDVVERVIAPLVDGRADAVDTTIPTPDTLVIVDGDRITDIPNRSLYRRGQTPQGFIVGTLRTAYDNTPIGSQATDDCTLVLRHVPGARLLHVDGAEENIKITTPIDLVLADRLIQLQSIPPSKATTPAGNSSHWSGRRVVIVGGTSGIGAAIATELAVLGARIAAVGRSAADDVTSASGAEAALAAAAASLGGVDDLFITAGVLHMGPLADQDAADIVETLAVNLAASVYLARAAHPHLAKSAGSLTLFTSSSFTKGRPNYAVYSATKAAIVNLMQALADEWSSANIRVNAVAPERANTPMRQAAFPNEDHTVLLSAEEVAAATLRLAASGLTGQVLDVRR